MRDHLGELEHVVLLAVLRLGGDGYGARIREEIHERTGRSISPGTIYPTLSRLERKGLVSSTDADPTPERGGRSRRLYRLESPGLEALRASRGMLDALGAGFESLLAGPEP